MFQLIYETKRINQYFKWLNRVDLRGSTIQNKLAFNLFFINTCKIWFIDFVFSKSIDLKNYEYATFL